MKKDIIDLLFNTISPDNVVVTDKDIEKFGKKDPSKFSLEMTTIKVVLPPYLINKIG